MFHHQPPDLQFASDGDGHIVQLLQPWKVQESLLPLTGKVNKELIEEDLRSVGSWNLMQLASVCIREKNLEEIEEKFLRITRTKNSSFMKVLEKVYIFISKFGPFDKR